MLPMNSNYNFNQLAAKIKQIGKELGFDRIGIANIDLQHEFNIPEKMVTIRFSWRYELSFCVDAGICQVGVGTILLEPL